MLFNTSLPVARLAAFVSLVALPGVLLDTSCSQCAATCEPGVTVTVHGSATAVLGASSTYVMTISNDGVGAGGFTCTSSGPGASSCTGTGSASMTLENGDLTAEFINQAPVAFDLVLTRDGTLVVNAHVMPQYAMNDVCGEQCQEGTVTLYAQQ